MIKNFEMPPGKLPYAVRRDHTLGYSNEDLVLFGSPGSTTKITARCCTSMFPGRSGVSSCGRRLVQK